MRWLIGCEESGVLRRALQERGHFAMSADLLPARDGEKRWHYQGNVFDIITPGMMWDAAVFFPPCTRLANSCNKHLYLGKKAENGRDAVEWQHMQEGAQFFNACLNAPIPRIAVENPIQHGHARAIIRKYDQIVQPWQFGHGEQKSICLWLKNLPPLVPTKVVAERHQRVWKMGPGEHRQRDRSETYVGIAEAIADQWGTPA